MKKTWGHLLEALRSGLPIILPTDTVYGVAVDPRIEGATQRLFDLKRRPPEKALPILGPSTEELKEIAVFDARAERLAERFWPGPLTLILPRRPGLTWELGGEDDTSVAVRIPAHPLTLNLLTDAGSLAVTSANISGEPAATSAQMAAASLGQSLPLLDGGPSQDQGSTVLSLIDEPQILRAGALSLDELAYSFRP